MKYFIILAIATGSFVSAQAQSKSDIDKNYGPPVNAYSVSENIWMTPEYATSGQLCRARLYPRQIDTNTNYIQDGMSLREVKDILDLLAPPDVRGQKLNDSPAFGAGNIDFQFIVYEHVKLDFVTSLSRQGIVSDKTVVVEFERIFRPLFVTIAWTDRKCVTQ